ncbi:MAG: 5-deoxy-glucuronate isomerase [Firmicutes bacterium]|nr:5-deoxy-glucuronate isomerase [Bacillota bacterium]
MIVHKPYIQREGYTPIVEKAKGESVKIDFGLLYLGEGKSYKGRTEGNEVGLVILSGRCTVEAGGSVFRDIGDRQDVFSGPAHTVYLPPGTEYTVTTRSWADIAVCSTPCDKRGSVRLVRPDEVSYRSVGQFHWRRDAYYMVEPRTGAHTLRVGEVIFPPGHWTLPPHNHDEEEEIYFYRIRPSHGFGLQLIYTDDGSINETRMVRDNDTIVVPRGYHPVAASPGDAVCVLWIMAPALERTPLVLHPDPRYSWAGNWDFLVK